MYFIYEILVAQSFIEVATRLSLELEVQDCDDPDKLNKISALIKDKYPKFDTDLMRLFKLYNPNLNTPLLDCTYNTFKNCYELAFFNGATNFVDQHNFSRKINFIPLLSEGLLKKDNKIKFVSLFNNKIDKNNAILLADALVNPHSKLEILDLSGTLFEEVDSQIRVSEAISRSPTLLAVNFKDSNFNQITALSKNIILKKSKIQWLGLCLDNLLDSTDAQELSNLIVSENTAMVGLNLAVHKINPDGLEKIGKALKNPACHITELSLYGTNENQFSHFLDAVTHNNTISKLQLNYAITTPLKVDYIIAILKTKSQRTVIIETNTSVTPCDHSLLLEAVNFNLIDEKPSTIFLNGKCLGHSDFNLWVTSDLANIFSEQTYLIQAIEDNQEYVFTYLLKQIIPRHPNTKESRHLIDSLLAACELRKTTPGFALHAFKGALLDAFITLRSNDDRNFFTIASLFSTLFCGLIPLGQYSKKTKVTTALKLFNQDGDLSLLECKAANQGLLGRINRL